jgi:hypothetical protein
VHVHANICSSVIFQGCHQSNKKAIVPLLCFRTPVQRSRAVNY